MIENFQYYHFLGSESKIKLINKIVNNIEENNLIEKNDKICIAISGGPDSVCLLDILFKLSNKYNLKLILIHINHLLRGDNADKDEEYIRKLSEKYKVKAFILRKNIKEVAKTENIGIEEAGRKVRYDFFNKILKERKFNKLATAHHLNDNVETFLFRLLRGTSIDGLGSISWKRDNVIRPFLNIEKSTILSYLSENNIKYRQDESNFENEYARNKIRNDLIPYLEKYSKNISKNISNIISEISDVNEFFNKKIIKSSKLSINHLKTLTKYIAKKEITMFLKNKNITTNRNKIDIIYSFIFKDGTKKLKINFNYELIKDYENLYIEKIKIGNGKKIVNVDLKKETKYIFNDYIIKFEICETKKINKEKNVQYLNYDKLESKLIIRTKMPGDQIIPLGMLNFKKIKRIFIDDKICAIKRSEIPILLCNETVVSILGFRISELFKIQKNSNKMLKIITLKKGGIIGKEVSRRK